MLFIRRDRKRPMHLQQSRSRRIFALRRPRIIFVITEIEDYFAKGCGRCERFATADCSTRRWAQGLAELRQLCLASGLDETVKWGHPCYMRGERNVALIGAFRDDFRLTFFNAALLKDSERILEKPGANTRDACMIRFDDAHTVSIHAGAIRAYLEEAVRYADAGVTPKKENAAFELPDELVEALDCDDELAEAFSALTPGRQRSYAIVLNAAKTSATRIARIAKFRDRIIAGKGANER
jgi:uncharacterized protein YdeI (YjbR/CyaY-like superfamily)